MNACLLFEQSGTFKRAFIEQEHTAIDIDYKDHYGQTDLKIDIFDSIEQGTIEFINDYDIIIAFFPCTWFSKQNDLIYSRKLPCFRKWDNEKADHYLENRYRDFNRAKTVLLQLIEICKKPLIIENPASRRIVDILGFPEYYIKDRSKHGDILRKPTYLYTYNGVKISDLDIIPTKRGKDVNHISTLKRSEISPIFAKNLVSHIILDGLY